MVGFLGVERVAGRLILKGGGSRFSTGLDWEGVSDPSYSSLSELRVTKSLSSSSSNELPNLHTDSSALLFVGSSAFLYASCPTDPGVDRLPGIIVSRLPAVRVAMFWSLPTAHCSKEALSFVLISKIASCRVGSDLSTGGVTISGLAIGV